MDTATKTGIDAAKTVSKRGVQKTADATGDLIGKKQLIRLLQQVKQKKKQISQKKYTIRQKKDNKLMMILNYFE